MQRTVRGCHGDAEDEDKICTQARDPNEPNRLKTRMQES